MQENKIKNVNLEEAVQDLDVLFNVEYYTDDHEVGLGKTYRTPEYEYHILTEEVARIDVLTKLFEYFSDRIIDNGDVLCDIGEHTDIYTVFKLRR